MILNSYILEDRREKEKTATVNKISKKGTTTLLHRFRILAHLDFELDSEARSARRNKVLTLRKEVKEPGDSLPDPLLHMCLFIRCLGCVQERCGLWFCPNTCSWKEAQHIRTQNKNTYLDVPVLSNQPTPNGHHGDMRKKSTNGLNPD